MQCLQALELALLTGHGSPFARELEGQDSPSGTKEKQIRG